jgi:hypothetical protein
MRFAILIIPLLLLGCTAVEQPAGTNISDNVSAIADNISVKNDTQDVECTCSQDYLPVCGADNRTYQNLCNATCAGIRVQYDGKCKPITPLCTDNDGNDIKTQGTVSAGGISYIDKCEGIKVKEYICSDNKVSSSIIECASGFFCKNGKCIKGTPNCSDTDGGYNIYQPGSLKIRSLIKAEYLDKCLSKTKLREYYCENDEMVITDVDCKFGCLQASCNVQ